MTATKTAPKRRTPAQLATYHKELAAQHERKARIASDPVYAAAVKLHHAMSVNTCLLPEALVTALDAYLYPDDSAS